MIIEENMELKLILGIITTLLAFPTFIPYLKDIVQRKTEPHTYTWLIWTILQSIGVYAGFQDGGGFGMWGLAIGAVFCAIIFLLSLKYGTTNITRFDLYCLVGAFITLGIYLFTNNGLLAVLLVAIIDFVGFLPTFRKGWEEPETETISTFGLSAFGNLLSVFALENYTFITTLYVGSLLFTNTTFATMIYLRRTIFKKEK